jgi:DNA-binding response OmpR family regulator
MSHPPNALNDIPELSGAAFPAREGVTASGARILVVEDEEDLAGLLLYNLRAVGHVVEHAHTGAAALGRVKEFRPDLVLLDLMLPDIDGTEVLQAIRRDKDLEHTSVMIVTARGEQADRIAGLELGANDYVAKPFGIRDLVLRVEAVLNALARNSWIDMYEVGPPDMYEVGPPFEAASEDDAAPLPKLNP